jgi:hypothetical protein
VTADWRDLVDRQQLQRAQTRASKPAGHRRDIGDVADAQLADV